MTSRILAAPFPRVAFELAEIDALVEHGVQRLRILGVPKCGSPLFESELHSIDTSPEAEYTFPTLIL